MNTQIYSYPILIKEHHLDMLGHVNNIVYLLLFEEARWELVTKNGYGFDKIMETGLGPVILEIKSSFLKEVRLREHVIIETQLVSYYGKIGKIAQRMIRGEDVCCTAEITLGLFSLKERKIVLPTPEWLKAIGISNAAA